MQEQLITSTEKETAMFRANQEWQNIVHKAVDIIRYRYDFFDPGLGEIGMYVTGYILDVFTGLDCPDKVPSDFEINEMRLREYLDKAVFDVYGQSVVNMINEHEEENNNSGSAFGWGQDLN